MNARQFFDVWPDVVHAVTDSRLSVPASFAARATLYTTAMARHGPVVAEEALAMFWRYVREPLR